MEKKVCDVSRKAYIILLYIKSSFLFLNRKDKINAMNK